MTAPLGAGLSVVVDLHLHYPMHVAPEQRGHAFELLRSTAAQARPLDRVRAGTVHR